MENLMNKHDKNVVEICKRNKKIQFFKHGMCLNHSNYRVECVSGRFLWTRKLSTNRQNMCKHHVLKRAAICNEKTLKINPKSTSKINPNPWENSQKSMSTQHWKPNSAGSGTWKPEIGTLKLEMEARRLEIDVWRPVSGARPGEVAGTRSCVTGYPGGPVGPIY